jgi:hypothetical protein
MAGIGTAPRKVNGVWVTRTGRRLSAAGQRYWENQARLGITDTRGHIDRAKIAERAAARQPKATQPAAPPKKPSFDTVVAARKGDREAQRQIAIYAKSRRATAQAKADVQALQDQRTFGAAMPAVKASARATRLNPVAEAVIKSVSPGQAVLDTAHALKKHRYAAAGLSALGILPVGPTGIVGKGARLATGVERAAKAERAARVAEAGLAGRRSLQVGEMVQQVPRARSGITRTVIEKPADVVSRRLPRVPYAGAEARVAKHAARANALEAERAQGTMVGHLKALPKEGSNEDVAHFWWAQLPKAHRNVAGLKAVRAKQAARLEAIISGRIKPRGPMHAADLPLQAHDLSVSIAQLDAAIQAAPKLNPKVIGAVHALSGDRAKVLRQARLLTPERAAERRGLVSRWLGVQPTGEEAFIGHRLGPHVQGAQAGLLPVSPGAGRVRLPRGVGRENRLVLANTGRLRQSTHVAGQDWQATQVYRQAVRARNDLAKMGRPFSGRLGKDEVLINPKGRPVPPAWKTDQLARMAAHGSEDDARKAAEAVQQGFMADASDMDRLIQQAHEQGVRWDELRVVPKKTFDRYYGQFLPARRGGTALRAYDRAIDWTSASIIFARLGYVPKNIVQNLVMAVPHQGAYLLANAPRAAQALKDAQLRRLLSVEVGQGATAALGKEATTAGKTLGFPGKLAGGVSGVADTPMRISAFLHEAAAEGVIAKLNPVLTDKDRAALVDLLTNPKRRPQLNDIRQRSVEAMADFSRLTPSQRKAARRLFIIPGWLVAGSRYPIHFAATHPLRSAGLGYVAAGEPGSPRKLNRPVDEYFAKGLPPWLQGVDTPGGKLLRTTSISPVNTPVDVANAVLSRSPQTIGDYANPLGTALYNIASRQASGPYGPYRTSLKESVQRNLERLTPGVQFAKQEITGDTATKTYPGGRLSRLERELGIVPVQVNREAAQVSASGYPTRAASVTTDQEQLLAKIDAAGFEPSPQLKQSYDLRLERAKRLDKIHAHGLTYQQKAYRADLQLLVERGTLTKDEAAQTLAESHGASEERLKTIRAWLGKHMFGGEDIAQTKRYLHQAGY